LNAEAALVCVYSKVDELVQQPPDQAVKWLDILSPLIIKLKRCVEFMCTRAKSGLAFITLQVHVYDLFFISNCTGTLYLFVIVQM